MIGLAIMLAVALIPEPKSPPYVYSGHMLSYPVKCVMDQPSFGFNIVAQGTYTVVSEVILLGALLVRISRIFPASRHVSTKSLRFVRTKWLRCMTWSCEKLEDCPQRGGSFTALPLVVSLAYLIAIQVFFDFLRSGAFEVSLKLNLNNLY